MFAKLLSQVGRIRKRLWTDGVLGSSELSFIESSRRQVVKSSNRQIVKISGFGS